LEGGTEGQLGTRIVGLSPVLPNVERTKNSFHLAGRVKYKKGVSPGRKRVGCTGGDSREQKQKRTQEGLSRGTLFISIPSINRRKKKTTRKEKEGKNVSQILLVGGTMGMREKLKITLSL